MKTPLQAVIDPTNMQSATKKLLETRKVIDEGDTVTYEEVIHEMGDKVLKLRGTHVPLEEVHKMANGKCSNCMSKGYTVVNLPKSKVPDPSGYMILEEEMPEGLEGDQKKIWEARVAQNPFWKVITNCDCAANKYLKKNHDVLMNGMQNIFIRIDYDIVPKEVTLEAPKVETKAEEPVNIYVQQATEAKVDEPKQE